MVLIQRILTVFTPSSHWIASALRLCMRESFTLGAGTQVLSSRRLPHSENKLKRYDASSMRTALALYLHWRRNTESTALWKSVPNYRDRKYYASSGKWTFYSSAVGRIPLAMAS